MNNLMLSNKNSDAVLFMQMIASQSNLEYVARGKELNITEYYGKQFVIEPIMFKGSYKQIEKFYSIINGYTNLGLDYSVLNSARWIRSIVLETTFMWATTANNYPWGFLKFKIESTGVYE